MQIKPFFINSNICTKEKDISSFEKFMNSVAGNTGNSYITYALIKELFGGLIDIQHIQNIYEYNFDNELDDIDYINNEATHVFLILQDQIRISESYGLKLPYKKIMNFISKLNKPVIIAGLGTNSFTGFDSEFHKKLDINLVDFLKFLSDHCIEIGIRGHFTEEVLHNIGVDNTKVIGCPSFYEMGRERIIVKKEITDLKSVLLTQRLELYTPKIHKIMQDFQERDIIESIAFNIISDHLFPHHVETFYNQTYHIFSNIEEWKDFVKNFKFALGNRVHGSILSINSGVPAVCINKDSRATEMCALFKIPHIPNFTLSDEKDILELYNNVDYSELNSNYPILFDDFVKFLHKNNLQIFEENEDLQQDNLNYTKQPSLNLYSNLFYANLDNKIFLNNRVNEIIFRQQEDIKSLALDLTSLKEACNHLIVIIKSIEEQNRNLLKRSKKAATISKFIKGFLQQIFSVKEDMEHNKTLRILGLKIKIRKHRNE